VLLGLAQVGLPQSYAQMYYSGGFVQRHRRAAVPAEPAAPKTTPAAPPSYFPDNDISYATFGAGGELGSSPSFPAGGPLFGVAAAAFPWNQAGFVDYNEPLLAPRDASIAEPKKYFLEVKVLPREVGAARPETAMLIARLPEQAAFWVQGTRTQSVGRTRYFQSPPLVAGRKYGYTVRAVWLEDGQWVSQTHLVPVQAGAIQAIYLRPLLAAKSALKTGKE
jgi:uncharacterized protein (TIGR03000 family)